MESLTVLLVSLALTFLSFMAGVLDGVSLLERIFLFMSFLRGLASVGSLLRLSIGSNRLGFDVSKFKILASFSTADSATAAAVDVTIGALVIFSTGSVCWLFISCGCFLFTVSGTNSTKVKFLSLSRLLAVRFMCLFLLLVLSRFSMFKWKFCLPIAE